MTSKYGVVKVDPRYLSCALLLPPHALRLPRRFGLLHSLDLGELACLSRGFAFGGCCEFGVYASLLLGCEWGTRVRPRTLRESQRKSMPRGNGGKWQFLTQSSAEP